MKQDNMCPICKSPLKEPEETPSGKKLQRCSRGNWNSETRQAEGCEYVKWLNAEPKKLDEKCPKCGADLVLQVTRAGKKMKKCSTNAWDPEQRVATGCDFVEWINGSTEPLKEDCPQCGEKLVLFTTASGKKMKKCSTAGWNRDLKEAFGCTFVEWINDTKRE